MISTDFSNRADAIQLPGSDALLTRDERVAAHDVYRAAHAELNQEFADALAAEYLDVIAESRVEAVAAPIFAMAWENGHPSGYSEVELCYMDLAEIATTAYAVATS